MGGSKIQFSPFLKSNIQFRPRSTTLIHSVSNPLHSRTPQIQFRLNLPSGPTPAQQLRIATYSATRRRQSVLTSYASPLPSVVRSNPLALFRPIIDPTELLMSTNNPGLFSSSHPLPAPLCQGYITPRKLTSDSEPDLPPHPSRESPQSRRRTEACSSPAKSGPRFGRTRRVTQTPTHARRFQKPPA